MKMMTAVDVDDDDGVLDRVGSNNVAKKRRGVASLRKEGLVGDVGTQKMKMQKMKMERENAGNSAPNMLPKIPTRTLKCVPTSLESLNEGGEEEGVSPNIVN